MSSIRPQININNKYDRIILLVDMDCFYCQVEEKLNSDLKNKPVAVVQYNPWRGGGIIAVNYAAREKGVTRHMRGDEAKQQCPDINLISVPNVREKGDLSKYRDAGKEVANVLQTFTPLLERASVDEAYLDITDSVLKRLGSMNDGEFELKPDSLLNTYALGFDNIGQFVQIISSKIENDTEEGDFFDTDSEPSKKSDIKLLIGASIANEIRAKVKEVTSFECSAGIAHNKILAKLACGINKPNKQTIIPLEQVPVLFSTLPIGKIKGLGGKFGEEVCQKLNIKFMGDLIPFSEKELQRKFEEKNGTWLYLMARGIDLEAVTPRFISKSIGCSKNFPGKGAITEIDTLKHWLKELSIQLCQRLQKDFEENNRKAKQLVIGFTQEIQNEDTSLSRTINFEDYDTEQISNLALDVIRKNTDQFLKPNTQILNNAIKHLSLAAGKFESFKIKKNTLQQMFKNQAKKKIEQNETQKEKSPVLHSESSERDDIISNNFIDEKKESELEACKSDEVQRSFFAKYLQGNTSYSDSKQISEGENSIDEKENFSTNFDQECSNEESTTTNNIKSCNTNKTPCSTTMLDKQPQYLDTYAEFAVPTTSSDDFVICNECNKKVLLYSLQAHKDFHYALKLSQEQREEFRKVIKNKISNAGQPSTKKLKNMNESNSKNIKTPVRLIDKFLIKNELSGPSQIEKQKCPECDFIILDNKFDEHKDFHLAQKIQRDLNSASQPLQYKKEIKSHKKSRKGKSYHMDKNKEITKFFISQE